MRGKHERFVRIEPLGVSFDMVVVGEFVQACVATHETLEILLSLFRDGGPMTFDDLAEALAISARDVSRVVEELVALEIVEVLGGDDDRSCRYAPRTAELAGAVEQVAAAYEHDRVWLIKLMTNNAIARVRTNATQAFIRRKKD